MPAPWAGGLGLDVAPAPATAAHQQSAKRATTTLLSQPVGEQDQAEAEPSRYPCADTNKSATALAWLCCTAGGPANPRNFSSRGRLEKHLGAAPAFGRSLKKGLYGWGPREPEEFFEPGASRKTPRGGPGRAAWFRCGRLQRMGQAAAWLGLTAGLAGAGRRGWRRRSFWHRRTACASMGGRTAGFRRRHSPRPCCAS